MRLVLAAVTMLLLIPTAAEAAAPKVAWPAQSTYAPGETISVKVTSKERVTAALVRESASGKVMRTVARRTLRRGTFSAKAPSAGRYALRVGARERTISVVAPPSTTVSSGPLPPATIPPLPDCSGPTSDRAELRLGAPSAPAGGTLPLEVVNTGTGCLTLGVSYGFERLQDGAWVPVRTNQAFIMIGLLLGPGQTLPKQAQIPADFAPGTYRVVDSVRSGAVSIPLAAQFEVTS